MSCTHYSPTNFISMIAKIPFQRNQRCNKKKQTRKDVYIHWAASSNQRLLYQPDKHRTTTREYGSMFSYNKHRNCWTAALQYKHNNTFMAKILLRRFIHWVCVHRTKNQGKLERNFKREFSSTLSESVYFDLEDIQFSLLISATFNLLRKTSSLMVVYSYYPRIEEER